MEEDKVTPEEFLLKRTESLLFYRDFYPRNGAIWDDISTLVANQMDVIYLHRSWPVLVETEPEFETLENELDTIRYRVSQQLQWMTEQEYIKRFGRKPPTAPLIRKMLERYQDHPDFDPEWLK